MQTSLLMLAQGEGCLCIGLIYMLIEEAVELQKEDLNMYLGKIPVSMICQDHCFVSKTFEQKQMSINLPCIGDLSETLFYWNFTID